MSIDAIALPAQNEPPQGLLVALHGWGANAYDLAGLAPYLDLPDYQLIFPDAPFPHPYAPGGRMWYSLPSTYGFQSQPDFSNQPEIVASRQQLTNWLNALEGTTGVALSRTILAGFSQGGAMTLDVGLHLPLAALLVMSGYLHAPVKLEAATPPPVLMVHGRYDNVVPLNAAQQAKQSLLDAGVSVQYEEFDMGHEIQPVILEVMQSFVLEGAFHLGARTRNSLG